MTSKNSYLQAVVIAITATITMTIAGCGGSDGDNGDSGTGGAGLANLGISPKADANAGSSFSNSVPDNLHINYYSLPRPAGTGDLTDAIAYLDADGDGDTDIFMGTGQYLLEGEVDSVLYLNDGAGNFSSATAPFGDNMPPATHARKSLSADFTGNGLMDVLVLDHGYDADPFPGSQPKLIIQDSVGSFTWRKLTDQTGFHHGGAAADIDNDGDIDIFVGGFDPFFYVNDGAGNFTKADNRFDDSIEKVFSAELIDIDEDGFIDLMVGAHERDGNVTRIYWGSTSGSYSSSTSFAVPAKSPLGAVLDFDAADLDGDGDLDLIINRTRDGDDGAGAGFYQGATVQYLRNDGNRGFTDVSASLIDLPGDGSSSWFPWVRVWDIEGDGDLDFGPDNSGRGFYFSNDGTGAFTRTAL